MFRTPLVAALLAPLALAQGPETVQVGSTPSYEFKTEIFNGAGLNSLAALRGKPTIIEFWGTR